MIRLLSFFLGCCLLLPSCKESTPESESGTMAETNEVLPVFSGRVVNEGPMPNVLGWLTPIQLKGVTTEILLRDYFTYPDRIDAVRVAPGLEASLASDKSILSIQVIGDPGQLSNLEVQIGDQQYDILVKTSNKRKVTLRLRDQGFKKVQVKGEMNAWNPQTGNCVLQNGIWECTFEVNPGDYQYLFVVDGAERKDPKNSKEVSNGQGGFNSLLSLPKPDPETLPWLRTVSAQADQITCSLSQTGAVLAYWENQLLPVKREGLNCIIQIPAEATKHERSFIRVFGQNEHGTGNDLLIPLHQGRVLQDPANLGRSDKEAQIMYFVLIDRFNNGNPGNDAPLEDARLVPATNYQGGDLAGITQKIKDGYFQSLGINALWLSPITQNPLGAYQEYPEPRRWYSGYHGYWPISSYKVDHRFGTDRELEELVSAAHANGINLLLDYVCNHVHEEHPLYQAHPEWATQLNLPDGRKNIRIWEEQRLTTWFDTFMPTLDLENPEVIEIQTDSALFWVKHFGLDGYRHDATKHIPTAFWRRMTQKLNEQVVWEQNRPIYQIGETYGSRELIAQYIGSGLLDAQFDFPMYFDTREVFAKPETSFRTVANALRESFNYFGYHSSMGYISGNHDQARFISLAGGDLSFEEDHREAAFSRTVGVGDPVGYKRLQLLHAYNMSIPGVPVIYYGDEIGIPGAGDPDSRRMMRFAGWNEEEAATKSLVESLGQLRRSRLSLIYGDTEVLFVDDTTLVLARTYFEELTVSVLYKGSDPRTVRFTLPGGWEDTELKTQFGSQISQENGAVSVQLEPVSFDFLIGNR